MKACNQEARGKRSLLVDFALKDLTRTATQLWLLILPLARLGMAFLSRQQYNIINKWRAKKPTRCCFRDETMIDKYIYIYIDIYIHICIHSLGCLATIWRYYYVSIASLVISQSHSHTPHPIFTLFTITTGAEISSFVIGIFTYMFWSSHTILLFYLKLLPFQCILWPSRCSHNCSIQMILQWRIIQFLTRILYWDSFGLWPNFFTLL